MRVYHWKKKIDYFRGKNNDPIHKIIPMAVHIRYNSSWNFRKTFAEHCLGDSVNQYYNIRLVDVQNYYYRLAYARLLSEKKYVDFKESAPELFSALRDNSDITSAKIMIAKLEKVLTDA